MTRKTAVAAAFGTAAADYDAAASLQHEVAHRLAGRIRGLALPTRPRVLELGCGTGFLARLLHPGVDPGLWLLTDLAAPMVARCRQSLGTAPERQFLVMDGERPSLSPTAPGFDLICASLVFQWFEDLPAALPGLTALLAPGGVLAFATLAAGSFAEWRRAHTELGLDPGTADYPAAADLARWWPAGGDGRIDEETLVSRHADARAFLADLKRIGAHLPVAGHQPLSAGEMRRVLRRFEQTPGIGVSYRIVYGVFKSRSGGRGAP